jgi:hypothetical protein
MMFWLIKNYRGLVYQGVIWWTFIFNLLFQSRINFFIHEYGLLSIQIIARMWILKYVHFLYWKIFVFMHFHRLINFRLRIIIFISKPFLLLFYVILPILNFILIPYWYIISKCNIFGFLLQIFKSFSFLMVPSIKRLNHVTFWITSIDFDSSLSVLRLVIWSDVNLLLWIINLVRFSLNVSVYCSQFLNCLKCFMLVIILLLFKAWLPWFIVQSTKKYRLATNINVLR